MLLHGEKCSLRSVGSKDIDTILLWENDSEVRRFGDSEKIFTHEDIETFVRNQQYDIATTEQQRFMIDTPDGRSIGAIDLFDYDGSTAGIGILVYDHADRRKGYAADALRTLIRYARNLRISVLHASVAADNTASLRLFDSCGFMRSGESEGTVRFTMRL